MTDFDPTARFTDRVADYVRARPGYPASMLDWIRMLDVDASSSVADIGAGTGISSKVFLDAGHSVTAIEPNAAMRAAAIEWLGANPNFRAIDGTAEHTTLDDHSVDLVSAAQAFHWFDRDAVRREWSRILSERGLAIVYWNTRRLDGSAFLRGYEHLLRTYDQEYARVAAAHPDDATMRAWFGAGFRDTARFDYGQTLDFDHLVARLLSSSHAPKPVHAQHEPMMRALRVLFDSTESGGLVDMQYETRIFAGKLTAEH